MKKSVFCKGESAMAEKKDLVLIVDDDEAVQSVLYKVISSNGIDAQVVSSGEEALEVTRRYHFDLILLDVNMRGIDGFEVVQALRKRGVKTPIIIVSGRKEDYDTLYGLDIGADDYITKPFNPIVLGAKVKALIRRSKGTLPGGDTCITAGPFRYNTSTLRFYKNDQEIILSSKENAMIKLFIDNVNRIFPKDMIYELIWGETIVDENAIMVYINRLRQKIEDNPSKPKSIQTVRGLGYRFVV
jgi:DNA-binding response OmpR family regulator